MSPFLKISIVLKILISNELQNPPAELATDFLTGMDVSIICMFVRSKGRANFTPTLIRFPNLLKGVIGQ